MYAIKFVREFKRCCCCYHPNRGYHLDTNTRKHSPGIVSSSKGTGVRGGCGGGGGGTGNVHVGRRGENVETTSCEQCTSSLTTSRRSVTPPHIAQGKGTKNGFDKYFMI